LLPDRRQIWAGRIKELAEACRSAGINRPLLVTDAGLASSHHRARQRS
jgi:hypothetical protein